MWLEVLCLQVVNPSVCACVLVRDILVLALCVTAQPWRVAHFDEYVRHVKLILVNQSWIFIMVQLIKSFQEPLRVGE